MAGVDCNGCYKWIGTARLVRLGSCQDMCLGGCWRSDKGPGGEDAGVVMRVGHGVYGGDLGGDVCVGLAGEF